ncbi:MAG: hypothetical protein JSV89_13370 [Spirochaetaceae bacterium]|nr:MAG: hypothetical protein JSV89_13370 [Spirochaetaceae bacterium]
MILPHFPADRRLDTEFQRELREITELSSVYYATIRFQSGENTVRLSCSFQSRFPEGSTRIWAFPALQYSCQDTVSLARQNFLGYIEDNQPIVGD